MHLEVLFRLSLGIAALTIACSLYVMLVPEHKRLKYKYREKHSGTTEHHWF